MTAQPHYADALWAAAADIMDRPDISRSTMMGLACLRVSGAFFAALNWTTGELLVKLSRGRVDELLATGACHPFAPAGRRFPEWVAVPPKERAAWPGYITEALARVEQTSARGR